MKTAQYIKEDWTKIWKNLRKKNQTEILEIKSPLNRIKNAVEGYSSRLEQVEDQISRLKDKIDITEKKKDRSTLRQKI
jgi:predicted  nucleic acid-binding Zn-ribbon protein